MSEESDLSIMLRAITTEYGVILVKRAFFIQGGPEKKHGTAYFPQYMDAITGISACIWRNFFWEKWYQYQKF